MIAKCGCNCTRCPTYKENLPTFEARQRCSWGWKTYIGVNLSPEKLRLCDGCFARDEDKPTRYLNCIIRKCALRNGIDNCAYCANFPCEELKTVHTGQNLDYRERIESRIGRTIPRQDYLDFVEPYMGLKHLIKIRHSLTAEDIVTISGVSIKSKAVAFPDALPLSTEERAVYNSLYNLIYSITRPLQNISFAQRESEKKHRRFVLSLLWTFGIHGEVETGRQRCLAVNSIDFYKEKNQAKHAILLRYFSILEGVGLVCTLMPLVEKEWISEQGFLRIKPPKKTTPAWLLRMCAREEAGGFRLLAALQNYAMALHQIHGEKAFPHFLKADMTVLNTQQNLV